MCSSTKTQKSRGSCQLFYVLWNCWLLTLFKKEVTTKVTSALLCSIYSAAVQHEGCSVDKKPKLSTWCHLYCHIVVSWCFVGRVVGLSSQGRWVYPAHLTQPPSSFSTCKEIFFSQGAVEAETFIIFKRQFTLESHGMQGYRSNSSGIRLSTSFPINLNRMGWIAFFCFENFLQSLTLCSLIFLELMVSAK